MFFWPEPGAVASRVHGFLQVDKGEGLRLLWYSDLQELENEKGIREPEDEDELFLHYYQSLLYGGFLLLLWR